MHSVALLSALSVSFSFASAYADPQQAPETRRDLVIPRFVPEISVLEANKSYVVKLDCIGCPSAVQGDGRVFSWQSGPENALRLGFMIEQAEGASPALSLNGRHIMPMESSVFGINTWQVAANLTTEDKDMFMLSPASEAVGLSMEFEHTVLRTREAGETWLQFDVTSLFLPGQVKNTLADTEPVKLDKEGQKLIQMQLKQDQTSNSLSIGDIQVVARKDRLQPYRMKCGKLAMVQTHYNPAEWDEYGQFGTWTRLFNTFAAFLDWQQNPLLIPVGLALAIVILVGRRWMQNRQSSQSFVYDDEAQIALLEEDSDDLPPPYANIPMIKIEEYD